MRNIIGLLISSTVVVYGNNAKPATASIPKEILPLASAVSPQQVLKSDRYNEGIVFDRQGNFYFSQTKAGTITIVSPDGSSRIWAKVEGANGHKILPDGTHIVAAKNAVVQLDADGKILKTVAKKFDDKALIYPNDITVDPQGGFYFTDSGNPTPQKPNGAVYYVDAGGKLNQIASKIAFANGIILSSDRKRLFVSESNRNRILVYKVTKPGQLEQKQVFARLPVKQKGEIDNQPDGLCLDATGNLYVAHYGTRHIEVLNSNGKLIRRYPSGNLTTSNCAFGGKNLDSLFVTGGIEEEAGAGGIFRLDIGVQGLDIRPSQLGVTSKE
jgi:gluconolactonase